MKLIILGLADCQQTLKCHSFLNHFLLLLFSPLMTFCPFFFTSAFAMEGVELSCKKESHLISHYVLPPSLLKKGHLQSDRSDKEDIYEALYNPETEFLLCLTVNSADTDTGSLGLKRMDLFLRWKVEMAEGCPQVCRREWWRYGANSGGWLGLGEAGVRSVADEQAGEAGKWRVIVGHRRNGEWLSIQNKHKSHRN